MTPVMNSEITPYGKRSCPVCTGLGRYKVLTPREKHAVCGCAIRRFLRAHPDIHHNQQTGEFFWPEKEKTDAAVPATP